VLRSASDRKLSVSVRFRAPLRLMALNCCLIWIELYTIINYRLATAVMSVCGEHRLL
jgi:hypothetical protein